MNPVSTTPASDNLTFEQLGLPEHLLSQLNGIGYEAPSPIQAQTIPLLLEGRDIVGQAQTGTGKTAAFALPALTRLDETSKVPQVLVLTPTRELSIQVAEAFQTYAGHMKRFSVLPVYGGQDYRIQVSAIKRGVQVIVSTPGRLMDHIRRGVLSLEHLRLLVLDEADEMLRMGFIDDVQWILDQTPKNRQIALFSATMPTPIKRIAAKHLNDPVTVEVKSKSRAAATVRQRFWPVQGVHKLDALTRILEAEDAEGVIVFVRTKVATSELADKLAARGMRSAALNGEIPQKQREQTVNRLRSGQLDILVATDVAARGLDVDRISHVINYDIPYDTESYVHRIGRTGRAGRSGQAVLFVAPRERRMLALIEKAVGHSIEKLQLPTQNDINEQRTLRLTKRISSTLQEVDLSVHKSVIEQYLGENEVRGADVAAALAYLLQQSTQNSVSTHSKTARASNQALSPSRFSDSPVLENPHSEKNVPPRRRPKANASSENANRHTSARQTQHEDIAQLHRDERIASKKALDTASTASAQTPVRMPALEPNMERFRLEVGQEHGAEPGKIVGAIANEAGIESQYIGRISIQGNFSLIDLPEGMPKAIFKDLKKTRVCGEPLRISRVKPGNGEPFGTPDRKTPNGPAKNSLSKRPKKNKKKGSDANRSSSDRTGAKHKKRKRKNMTV